MEKFKIEPHKTIDKIKHVLNMYELNLAQMKSEDGATIFEAEQFAPEYSVGIVQEEGIVPVPAGEYVLEDGKIMVIETDGVIARIDEAAAMSDEGNATPTPEAVPETTPAKKVVESVTKETFFSKEDAVKFVEEHEVALSKIETLEAEKAELEVKLAKAEEIKTIKHNPEKGKVKFEDMSPVEKFRYLKNQ